MVLLTRNSQMQKKKKKWKQSEIDKAVEYIGENPVLTLEEIIDKSVNENGSKKIVKQTLSNYLKSELITLKSVRINPIARNSKHTKNLRIKYCKDYQKNPNKTYIFIDEMGISVCTQRNKGRSKKGTRANWVGPLSKAANISICMAVSEENGVIHFSKQNGSFNSETFSEFIGELIQKCKELNLKDICFIMDNCKIHKSEESIKEQCIENDIELKFLPPYSPELNPIENVFSILKAKIKKLLRTKYYQKLLDSYKAEWGKKTKMRNEIIDDSLTESIPLITSDIMKKLYKKMMAVFTLVYERKNI